MRNEKHLVRLTCVASCDEFERDARNAQRVKRLENDRVFNLRFLLAEPAHQNLHGPPLALLNAHQWHLSFGVGAKRRSLNMGTTRFVQSF